MMKRLMTNFKKTGGGKGRRWWHQEALLKLLMIEHKLLLRVY
jgi:hypothetical protein